MTQRLVRLSKNQQKYKVKAKKTRSRPIAVKHNKHKKWAIERERVLKVRMHAWVIERENVFVCMLSELTLSLSHTRERVLAMRDRELLSFCSCLVKKSSCSNHDMQLCCAMSLFLVLPCLFFQINFWHMIWAV